MWRNSALGVRARITQRRETVLVALATLTLVSASTGLFILSRGASASQSARARPSTFSALPMLDISSFGFASPAGQVGQVGQVEIHHVGGNSETPSVITPITATVPIWASVRTTPASSASSSSDPLSLEAFYTSPDPLPAAAPGSIVRSEPIPHAVGLPTQATAYRVLYHSESTTGADIAVSGTVVIPARTPPVTGYPIVAWTHGTTGLANACAPSKQGVNTIPYLSEFIDEGMIVAATDYQGLGTLGIHPYLVGQSEGQAVLDAARAARNLAGSIASDSVIIFGHSQGGQAALFAGQISHLYAPDLFVVGVVAVAPVSNVSEFAPAVPGRNPDTFSAYVVMALYAWSIAYADVSTNRIFRSGWKDNTAVQTHLIQNEPGLAPTVAPVLIVQGTADSLIPYATTTTLVDQQLCGAQHDTVEYDVVRGASHGSVVGTAQPDVLQWTAARFAGQTAPNTCG